MKVGLLDSLGARRGRYWAAFLKELGVEVVQPALPAAEALALGQASLPNEPVQVQLVLGRVLELGRVDAVLVPQTPAVASDAWGEALTDLLPRRLSGLPPLIAIPDGGEALVTAAAELGQRFTGNPGRVRLALERVKPLAAEKREEMPPLSRGSRVTVAVIGPRALLADPDLSGGLRMALDALGLYGVFSSDLPASQVAARGERLENAARAPAGEKELFGALKLLDGKSAVRGVLLASPARDAAHRSTLNRLASMTHKPALVIDVDAGQTGWPELEAFRDRVTLGAPARPAGPEAGA
ncbi:hypothetical protein E5F05_20645 [Deinococcus metallilatus]|uniref:Uncharacterized protein n=1 Tax=Deinococcus metallilatus TaxID=1211322 RepID=A0AAJ5JZ48_9DEIO|nr:hypothetical protein [Deinococcus metallilatus]MBB5294382.1 hypothetical protein [Deinococcus metallilatus]QBY10137.1 hypothetical protein E5F05_20645 [Deinococcus metallilatus]RXJ13863.1 hypothetical protein ERJ73_04295 [Deinococcus metallilatus]TLK29829.1 hypothetical protein FCS05_04610 [Deinococcus metallilatus]GMA15598.1 hypothetical protein GCM10025871_19290 [Deinococcus metallilatus]